MNLDELKETWNNETIKEIPEVSLSKQKELKSPLALIRKNMRKELRRSTIIFTLLVLWAVLGIEDNKKLTYIVSLIFVASLVIIYYFWRFYKFHKEFKNKNYSTFQSLLELNYHLKYFTDLYVSYYVSSIPILLCEVIILLNSDGKTIYRLSIEITIFILFMLLFLFLSGKWHFNRYYGKHISKITKLLKEIKHPYEID